MYETPDDIAALQALLDSSYARAGEHLLSIHTPERRIPAAELPELLRGMQLLNLATVTKKGEPRVGPVDGLFLHGKFYFGSSSHSARYRHILARPTVSATHTRGEALAIVVHGTAVPFDYLAPEQEEFRRYCVEIYGEPWNDWGRDTAFYARIEAHTMFTYRMEE